MTAVDISTITKVYSGKAGRCMCGCAGKYSYTAAGRVLRNRNTDLTDPGYAVLEQNGRVSVVFFKE